LLLFITFAVGLIRTPRNTVFKHTLLKVPGIAIDGREVKVIPELRQNLMGFTVMRFTVSLAQISKGTNNIVCFVGRAG